MTTDSPDARSSDSFQQTGLSSPPDVPAVKDSAQPGRSLPAGHNGAKASRLSLSDKVMIQQQVHLQLPCYDFCPVQTAAIKLVFSGRTTVKPSNRQSPSFSKRLSSRQRRAVCTKGRDVINAS